MEILARNFLWMAAANTVNGISSILIFIHLARALLPEAFGYFSYALTIILFLANFVDLGLATYGIREIARNKARISYYASEIISFKIIMAFSIFIMIVLAVLVFPHTQTVKVLMLESCLFLFIFALASEWAFQGVEKMHMVFISFVTTSILQLTMIFLFVRSPQDLTKAPILFFLGALPIVLIFLRKLDFHPLVRLVDMRKILGYLRSSLVIWSISIFAQVYNSMDVFLVGLFMPPENVGYFSIARRIAGGVAMFLVFLANAALPRLSVTFVDNSALFKSATLKFFKAAILIAVLGLLPIIIFSKELIIIAFGPSYLPASVPLKIMLMGLVLVLFNMPYSTGLVAARMEKEVLKQSMASAALSVFLNFILVPKYGIIGASVSFLCAEVLALIWVLVVYKKRISFA